MKHSTFVKFIIQVRPIFMNQFHIHKKSFPEVNGEAMFVGTIIHSIEHTMAYRNLEDPLWLNSEDPKFGLMAQLGQIVKVGFVADLPGLYFHKRVKGSKHPFKNKPRFG